MLSIQTEARVAKLLLEIAKGENTIESKRRMMTNNLDFDTYQIFNFLDVEDKNRIDSIDIINYLTYKKCYITDIEAQLIILFYDQDFDGVLTFDEFKNLVKSENSLNSRPTAKNFLGKISKEIDSILFIILEEELKLVRNCLSLIDELKTRRDFDIHSIYHILRGFKCINEESLKDFFLKEDVIFSDTDLISIRRRLDLNKDGKIDLCELHAFLGYPECSVCCPNSPCPVCQMKDCNICFRDSPCFFHNSPHDNINIQYKSEALKRPSYLTYLPESNLKIDNDNSLNKSNIEYRNNTSPIRDINNNYINEKNIYNNNIIIDMKQNNNLKENLDNNNNRNIFSAKKVSKSLALRASPKRKFSPTRVSSSNPYTERNNSEINNDINNYLSQRIINDENQFLDYLRELMITEKKIEENKIKLSLNNDFNCEDAFRIFENEYTENLTKNDLKKGLNLLNIYPSDIDLDILLNKYCIKNKETIEFEDFFDIVVPYEKQYRNIVENRLPNSNYVLRSPSIFSFNTEGCLKDLFNLIIKEENKLNNIRKQFSNGLKNNLNEYFRDIDIEGNGHFNEKDLFLYIQKKGIFIDENSCDLLFIRLDNDRKGTVEMNEIEKEFMNIF